MDHHMRFDVEQFGEVEDRVAPTPVTGNTALAFGIERMRWLREEGTPAEQDPVRRNGIKRVSGLFRLPYWKVRIFKLFHAETFDIPYLSVLLLRLSGHFRTN